jgi:hypothetical protein
MPELPFADTESFETIAEIAQLAGGTSFRN